MKVIVTGVTGMVGEGVMLACLENPAIERVLAVARRPTGHTHAKLSECIVPDFRDVAAVEDQLRGYDGCFYCAGISSFGMKEAEYTVITYDTPVAFAETLVRLNPNMVFVHVSGQSTDGTEKGRVMWARVKGKAENALARLPFKAVYNMRPGLMKPVAGQRAVRGALKLVPVLYPALSVFFTGLTLVEVGQAMINAVEVGPPGGVLEARDIKELARRSKA